MNTHCCEIKIRNQNEGILHVEIIVTSPSPHAHIQDTAPVLTTSTDQRRRNVLNKEEQ